MKKINEKLFKKYMWCDINILKYLVSNIQYFDNKQNLRVDKIILSKGLTNHFTICI